MKNPEPPVKAITSNVNSTNGNVATIPTETPTNTNETTDAGKNPGSTAPHAISFASRGNTETLVTNEGSKGTATMAVNSKTGKEVIVTGGIEWSTMQSVTLKK